MAPEARPLRSVVAEAASSDGGRGRATPAVALVRIVRRTLLPVLFVVLAVVLVMAARVPSRAQPAGAGTAPTADAAARIAGRGTASIPVNGGRDRSGPGTALVPRPAAAGERAGTEVGATDLDHGDRADEPEGRDAGGSDGEIDLDGDIGPADRAWLAELAEQHRGERAEEPWVVHWTLVEVGEPVVDSEQVAAVAARALADDRGWALDGAIRFERVATVDEADFRLVVAPAEEVPSYSEDCRSWQTGDADASCTVGNDVIINDRRWRDGALGDPIPLEQFRVHELNHEVGHWLGQGHFSCLGGAAPLNQQQFRSLQGCTANEWPLPFERAMVAARFGLWPSLGAFEVYEAWEPARETAVEEPSTAVTEQAE